MFLQYILFIKLRLKFDNARKIRHVYNAWFFLGWGEADIACVTGRHIENIMP